MGKIHGVLNSALFSLSLAGLMLTGCRMPGVPFVRYVPTPDDVVLEMLELARVNPDDVVYDLGCGDGRFVITAAKKYGARGVGIDIDPERIKDSRRNARLAGVQDRVKFIEGDLFETDFREATVVALYLLPDLNLQLRPALLKDLKPGTRVVSHEFDMHDWMPDKMGKWGRNRYYYWVVPADASGKWTWTLSSAKGAEQFVLELTQKFQDIDGKIMTPVSTVAPLEAYLIGKEIGFVLRYRPEGKPVEMRFKGKVEGNTLNGFVEVDTGPYSGRHKWTARR